MTIPVVRRLASLAAAALAAAAHLSAMQRRAETTTGDDLKLNRDIDEPLQQGLDAIGVRHFIPKR